MLYETVNGLTVNLNQMTFCEVKQISKSESHQHSHELIMHFSSSNSNRCRIMTGTEDECFNEKSNIRNSFNHFINPESNP